MGSAQRIVLVVTPLVAMATLAVGLRIGASDATHAAVVRVAPHARGQTAYTWQITTILEDHGVPEVEPRAGVTVRAHAGNGKEATWTGDTDEDGVAEVRLDLPGVERGDPVDLDIHGAGLDEPLAHGRVTWDQTAWAVVAPGPFVRSSKREGKVALDVAILGERLVARVPTPVFVRAISRDDGHAIGGVTITPEPDPGLATSAPSATTCASGWARLDAAPVMMSASLSLHAKTADGRTGEWFGEMPVAPGAMDARVVDAKAGTPLHLEVRAPSERTAYVEIDDDTGRAFAAAAPMLPSGTLALASFDVPPLAPGLAWLVTSSDARGAEKLAGAALARPFLVAGDPMPPGLPRTGDACAVDAYLALHPAGGFHRAIGLDGFVGRDASNAKRKNKGRAIALASLAVAAVLEGLVIVQSSRRGKEGAGPTNDGLTVVVSLLLALLGFGLLAAFLFSHA